MILKSAYHQLQNIRQLFYSRRISVLLGYVAQFYSAIVSIAFAPFILMKIGPEAYGLVGVFMVAQAWFHLLDAGFSPTVNREAARYQAGTIDDSQLMAVIKGLESIIQLLFVPLVVLAVITSDSIANGWLNRESISEQEISLSIVIMVAIFGIRWLSGVRRGVLLGLEKHSVVYLVNILISTRCVIPVSLSISCL